uniref:Uncharacterized protein n=1 Tax=Micrurus paraensis TaxID=1970185 RepID=A0A2D4KQQ2_9SAUR
MIMLNDWINKWQPFLNSVPMRSVQCSSALRSVGFSHAVLGVYDSNLLTNPLFFQLNETVTLCNFTPVRVLIFEEKGCHLLMQVPPFPSILQARGLQPWQL